MSIPVCRKVKYKNGEISEMYLANYSYSCAGDCNLINDLERWVENFYLLPSFRQTKETVLQYYPRILEIVAIENDYGDLQDIDFRNYLTCLNDVIEG